MFENEAVCVTVETSQSGTPGATLRAQIWNRDGVDHAEVRYEKGAQHVTLFGAEALTFLIAITRDAAILLAAEPGDLDDRPPNPRRQAGF